MPRPWTGLLLTGGLATALTLLIAWPVILHPAHLIYGREIIGRQPDTYAVMQQFGTTGTTGVDIQPLTNIPGWLLARALDPVVAFNIIVLLSFPLTAMTTYALARYLTGSHGAGLIAGLAFAFSPAHLAHAAYHPYVAQTQWMPLYFLALIALVDRLSMMRIVGLTVACAGLVLSNYDAGLLGVVVSPVVLVAFWAIRPDADRNLRPLVWPALVQVLLPVAAGAIVWKVRPDLFSGASSPVFPIDDVAFFRARWWAYLTPAVDHPGLGGFASHVFASRNINLQLTEEQLFLGYALLILAAIALLVAVLRWRSDSRWRFVPALLAVGAVAVVVSLGPTSGSCDPASMAAACLIFKGVPLFHTFARFGIVAQLMVALAAGAGAVVLANQSRMGRLVATVLLVVAIFEYWPLPARAHDVLPTEAHRWIAATPAAGRTLDCYPGSQTGMTIPWLMRRDLSFLDGLVKTCGDPQLGVKLAGLGYSQVLVRRGEAASKLPAPLPPGLTLAKAFPDADVFAVSATPPRLLNMSSEGFFGYEHQGDDWWQWMGPHGRWVVRNTTPTPLRVSLAVDLVSVGLPRHLMLIVDDAPPVTISVGMSRQHYVAGPWTMAPGSHSLTFSADGEPIRPADVESSKDNRALTVAFRNDRWIDAP